MLPTMRRSGDDDNKIVTVRVRARPPGHQGVSPPRRRFDETERPMIVLGIILLLLGLLIGPSILTTLGIILLVVGLILNFVPIGGTRRRFY